ncbi:MAG TPA: patatin-like phospholipase family protein, partial [Bdellovibrionota bacterium]|nr:patatin-like phospholipase family protein [Bdellovibrionota bacterium]
MLGSCAGARKAPDPGSPSGGETYGPSEAYGPSAPPAGQAEPAYGPEPIQLRPLILVLGPGEARAFAHVGALRAIAEAKLPVAAIYATEMGALVGALYAMNANLNRFEWGLLRFPDDVFTGGKS